MASIIEQLIGLMNDEDKKKFAKTIAEHPEIYAQDAEANKLLELYNNGGNDDAAAAAAKAAADADAKAAADKVAADKVAADKAAADKAERDRLAAAAAAGDGNAAILAQLKDMNTNLDTRFKAIEKDMVRVADLPKYQQEMTVNNLRAMDDFAMVREEYRAEFGKALDRNAFQKFIEDQAKVGVKYLTDDKRSGFGKALDAFVSEDRIKLRIDNGVKEQMKTLRSGKSVAGSTETVALSAAQQVMAKAKEKAAGGNKSNLSAAIERLGKLDSASADVIQ